MKLPVYARPEALTYLYLIFRSELLVHPVPNAFFNFYLGAVPDVPQYFVFCNVTYWINAGLYLNVPSGNRAAQLAAYAKQVKLSLPMFGTTDSKKTIAVERQLPYEESDHAAC